jgi:Tol biopolymer transport system component
MNRIRLTALATVGLVAAACLDAAPAHATFPGHNGVLVFQRPVGHQIDLFTVQPDGSALRRLTATKTWEEKPEWSADGQRLTYARSAPSGEPTEIATMNAAGGDERIVTRFGSASSAPTWSPDGRLAYFSLHDFPAPSKNGPPPPAELYSIGQDGTGEQRLTRDKSIQTDPEWSPDGATIAYSQWYAVRGQPGVFDIGLSLMNPDGSNQRAILGDAASRDIVTQSWSPDGRQLVLEIATGHPHGRTPQSRQSDLAIVNADGTGLRWLTRTHALEATPVWSPDGQLIAFTSDRHARRGKLERNGKAFEVYTMRPDGSGIRRITHNHVPDLYPDWQPLP